MKLISCSRLLFYLSVVVASSNGFCNITNHDFSSTDHFGDLISLIETGNQFNLSGSHVGRQNHDCSNMPLLSRTSLPLGAYRVACLGRNCTKPNSGLPQRISEVPRGGGYKFGKSGKMTKQDHTNFCENVERVLYKKKPLLQGGSYCTHGGYLATLMKLTEQKWWSQNANKIAPHFLCNSRGHQLFWGHNGASRLFEFIGSMGINVYTSRQIKKSFFAHAFQKGKIQSGDTIILNRTNGSGHGAIFDRFSTDSSGRITKICYWSSNRKTRGYGFQCEDIRKISSMDLGGLR